MSDFAAAVQKYYEQKSDYNAKFQELLSRPTEEDDASKEQTDTSKDELLVERPRPIQEDTKQVETQGKQSSMPGDVKEDTAAGDITDQVAKDSKDSTASSHPMHDVDTGAKGGSGHTKADAMHHQATPGPVITDKMPEPASKEELKKRSEELNK